MALVECYPIGVISMLDNNDPDDKIIAIHTGDPTYNSYTDINQLPKHIFDEMIHFFTVYKMLEGKSTVLAEAKGPDAASRIVQESIERYYDIFENK